MGSLIRKAQKAISLIGKVNVWQTLKMYYKQPHDKQSSIHICNKSLIHVDKTARIEMTPGARLEFNLMEDPFKTVRPAKLILKHNSRLLCRGHIQVFEAVKIECLENSILEIGEHTYINHDSEIRCRRHISIGNGCAIAYGVLIQDSDYHTVYSEDGLPKEDTKPIRIMDNVWVGANAIILKGVTIGEGSIVGAGSIVTQSFPANVLIGGNPARIIRDNIRHS